MERVVLKAAQRMPGNKGARKQMRREGLVPGVVYGQGKETVSITLSARDLQQVLDTGAGTNVIMDLEINGGNTLRKETVMFKDIQQDIIFVDRLLHVDLLRISLKEKIEVRIPLNLVGELVGVKEGGILQIHLREAAIKCLPTQIPEHFNIDISALDIGQSLFVRDLSLPPEVEMLEDEDETIVTITAPRLEEEEEIEEVSEEQPSKADDELATETDGD